MSITIDLNTIEPLLALVAGVLVLLMPRLTGYILAVYLIAIGLLGILR